VLLAVLGTVKAWHGLASHLGKHYAGVPRHRGIGRLAAGRQGGRIAGRCHDLGGGFASAVAVIDDVAEHLAILVVHGKPIADDRAAVNSLL
jgi:hypothetical protein